MSYAGKPYPPPGPIAPPQEATNPLGVVALVLGIMSVFLGCPAAIGALITGWMGMKREPSGMARAGFTIGLIMTIFNLVAGIVGLVFFVFIVGLAGLGAYIDSQERATSSYSSFPSSDSSSDPFDSSYGSPDIAPFPVSMSQPMEMPKMPDPYVPPPYVPPTMPPGIDPATFPPPPNFGAPPSFGPPGTMPPGAFPPGLGPPTTMETLSPASDSDEADPAP